jgi:mgtE-like transporter
VRLAAGPPSRRAPAPWWRRLFGALRADSASARQSLVALAINSSTSLLAGAMLGSITDTFERFPGLLVMVPAAIGLRGNVFSALGSRISTSIHAGDYRPSFRLGSVVGDNAAASIALSGVLSLLLAVVATIVSVVFGIEDVSVLKLATISIVGGLMASAVVLVVTLALVAMAVRFEWDLDDLVAPVVSTCGDVVTVPALWLATFVVGAGIWSDLGGGVLVLAVTALGVIAWRASHERVRRIVHESIPVLLAAVILSTLAGLVLEKRLDTFAEFPALLVLAPAFVSSAGALGGLLASSLASGLHLGTIDPTARPGAAVWRGARILALAAVPVYLFNGAGAELVGRVVATAPGQVTPGLATMLAIAVLGAIGAVSFVVAIAYYGSIVAVRFGVDPDTYCIPVVTSSVDFIGMTALILAITVVGIG